MNDVLVVVLIINLIMGAFSIIGALRSDIIDELVTVVSIAFTLIGMYGIYLILCLKKLGYWLLIAPKILGIVVGLIFASDYYTVDSIVFNVASIAFISLLMLLRKNGKNAYQLLWQGYESDSDEQ